MLTALLQWLLHEAIDLEASSLGLSLSVVAILLMRMGTPPSDAAWRGMALASFTTMILCLLASGSWQASGLALPMAAWLGICVARTGERSLSPSLATSTSASPTASTTALAARWAPGSEQAQRMANAARIVAVALLIGFLLQTWRPVNLSWTQYQSTLSALDRGDLAAARAAAMASVAADPLDPARRRLLNQVLATEAAAAQSSEQFESARERVEDAIDGLLACDPSAAGNWAVSAETLIGLAAVAEQLFGAPAAAPRSSPTESVDALQPASHRLLERADAYLLAALERYPSNVGWHAQRAVLLSLLQKNADSRRELDSAFALSEATPHLDRKLAMQQIWLPPPLATDRFPASAIVRPSTSSMWVRAEPLCDFLRKQ